MPKVSKATIRTALIALDKAREGETSVTAQLRISVAIKDLETALQTYDEDDL